MLRADRYDQSRRPGEAERQTGLDPEMAPETRLRTTPQFPPATPTRSPVPSNAKSFIKLVDMTWSRNITTRKFFFFTLFAVTFVLPLHAHLLSSATLPQAPEPTAAVQARSSASQGEAPGLLLRRQQDEGSDCAGSEGQWNCMADTWQRCAGGQWSAVMDMAEGTRCSPEGLTGDFQIEHEDGSGSGGDGDGAATSAGSPMGGDLGPLTCAGGRVSALYVTIACVGAAMWHDFCRM